MARDTDEFYSLVFTNEEITEYLVNPLLANPLLSVSAEMGGEERVKNNMMNIDRYSNTSKKPPELSDEEYYEQRLEEFGIRNPYHRRNQITSVYFKEPKDSDGNGDWFCVDFFADYIAKLFCLGECFVFTDERARGPGSSETQGELAYEGQLQGRPPTEILTVMRELAEILAGAQKLERQNFDIPQREHLDEKQFGHRIDLYYPKGIKPKMGERVLDNYHFYFHVLP